VAVANFLLQDFPNARLALHTFFEQKLHDLPVLAKPDPARGTSSFYREYPEEGSAPLTELKEKISRAACVLDVAYSTSRNDLGLDSIRLGPLYSYLKEYGSGGYICHDPNHELYMGLDDLEEGVFLKDIPKRALHELGDARMKELLFHNPNPSKEDAEKYLSATHLHLFYHKMSFFYQASDLYIAAELHKTDSKPIDIVLPLDFSFDWLSHWKILDTAKLTALGIGTLRIIKKDSEEVVKIQEHGKEMRIIHPGFLPHGDFYTLLANCSAPFGSTGDHSLTDALSIPLATHYELRGHKFRLFKSFKELAVKLGCLLVADYLQASSELFDGKEETFKQEFQAQYRYYDDYKTSFLNRMAAMVASASETMCACMIKPGFHQEWEKVVAYIKKERNARESLRLIVSRHLAMSQYPQLQKIEEQGYQDYRLGNKSLEAVHQELQQQIKLL
jgi:hypothetical protein